MYPGQGGSTPKKEAGINFQTRTVGIFEIIEPVLEKNEISIRTSSSRQWNR